MKPSSAEYQRYRTTTLRSIERERIKDTARQLMKQLRAQGHHFPKRVDKGLRRGVGQ